MSEPTSRRAGCRAGSRSSGRIWHFRSIDGAQEHPRPAASRNFFPACAPRTNSGTFAASARQWAKPRLMRIILRPLMPPTFRLFGSQKQIRSLARRSRSRGDLPSICQMVLHVFSFQTVISLLFVQVYHSCVRYPTSHHVSPMSSGADRAAPTAGQRAGRITADVADQRFSAHAAIRRRPCRRKLIGHAAANRLTESLTASWADERR